MATDTKKPEAEEDEDKLQERFHWNPADLVFGEPKPAKIENASSDEIDLVALRNAFCPTGEGGGVDSSCGPGGSSGPAKPKKPPLTRDVAEEVVDALVKVGKQTGQAGKTRKSEVTMKGHHIATITEETLAVHITQGGGTYKQMYIKWEDGVKNLKVDPSKVTGTHTAGSNLAMAKRTLKSTLVDAMMARAEKKNVANAFCPTGPGGGVDPTCSPGGGGISAKGTSRICKEKALAPPPGKYLKPKVQADPNGDGVTDMARVGVPAYMVPPPPKVPRLPNLAIHERKVEASFRKDFHNDPDGMAEDFRKVVHASKKPGEPPTFGTDDAKLLSDVWNSKELSLEQRSQNRATLNLALHQTANAITKRAFLKELDTLKSGDEILVTVGGCGAGKGFALKNVPEALQMKSASKVVWDSAGDQNATENPWIQAEAEKRGLKVNYIYVHADAKKQWADPERGVVKRAQDPADGRMVDAHVFADSYAIGAKNHQAFYEAHKDNPNASFRFLDNTGTPKLIDGIPPEALQMDSKELTRFAIDVVVKREGIPPHVKRGATMGLRVWGNPQ